MPPGVRGLVPVGAGRLYGGPPPTSSSLRSVRSTRARRSSSPSGTRPRVATASRIRRPTGTQHLGVRDLQLDSSTNTNRPGANNVRDDRRLRYGRQQTSAGHLITISFSLPTTNASPTDNEWWQIVLHVRRRGQRCRQPDRCHRPDDLEREHRGRSGAFGRMMLGRKAQNPAAPREIPRAGVTFRGRRPIDGQWFCPGTTGPAPGRGGRPLPSRTGTTLIEAAIITPLFFLLIFGIIEVGGAYKDKLAVGNAVTGGARTGSASADDASRTTTSCSGREGLAAATERGRVRRRLQRRVGRRRAEPEVQGRNVQPGTGSDQRSNRGVQRVHDRGLRRGPEPLRVQAGVQPRQVLLPVDRKVALTAANGGPRTWSGCGSRCATTTTRGSSPTR